ncbi:MAG: hypothetical protein U9N59_02875 [Campylobacterota bacterium]|nr:hypothetical protein [Campylobacterota bacterium]
MPKIDGLKEKINILRDDYRNLFIFFMTILTGSFTVFYQVIIGKLLYFYATMGLFGLIIVLFVVFKMKEIKTNLDILIKELEELDYE